MIMAYLHKGRYYPHRSPGYHVDHQGLLVVARSIAPQLKFTGEDCSKKGQAENDAEHVRCKRELTGMYLRGRTWRLCIHLLYLGI